MSTTNYVLKTNPKQFNFSRYWRKLVAPHLDDSEVQLALWTGMSLQMDNYKPGDAPWLHGRGTLNGQRAIKGCLSWYQPWGRCHFIAPFAFALGKKIFPQYKWAFLTSERHTVALGYESDPQEPAITMDILLFKSKQGKESIDFVLDNRPDLTSVCNTIAEYVKTFPNGNSMLQAFGSLQVGRQVLELLG